MTDEDRTVLWRWSAWPRDYTFDPSKPFTLPAPQPAPFTSTFATLEAMLTGLGDSALGIFDKQRHYHWPESPDGEWYYDRAKAIAVLRATDLHRHFQRYHPAHLARQTWFMRLRHDAIMDVQPILTTAGGSYWVDGILAFTDDLETSLAAVLIFQTRT